jgi:hypothetical protein
MCFDYLFSPFFYFLLFPPSLPLLSSSPSLSLGAGVAFGPDRAQTFLQVNDLKMIVRSHECVRTGMQTCTHTDRHTLHICTVKDIHSDLNFLVFVFYFSYYLLFRPQRSHSFPVYFIFLIFIVPRISFSRHLFYIFSSFQHLEHVQHSSQLKMFLLEFIFGIYFQDLSSRTAVRMRAYCARYSLRVITVEGGTAGRTWCSHPIRS